MRSGRTAYTNTDLLDALGEVSELPGIDLDRLAAALAERLRDVGSRSMVISEVATKSRSRQQHRDPKSLEISPNSLDPLLQRLANIEVFLADLLARKKAAARGAVKGSRTRAERAKTEAQRYFAEHPLSEHERETMLSMVRAQRLRR